MIFTKNTKYDEDIAKITSKPLIVASVCDNKDVLLVTYDNDIEISAIDTLSSFTSLVYIIKLKDSFEYTETECVKDQSICVYKLKVSTELVHFATLETSNSYPYLDISPLDQGRFSIALDAMNAQGYIVSEDDRLKIQFIGRYSKIPDKSYVVPIVNANLACLNVQRGITPRVEC